LDPFVRVRLGEIVVIFVDSAIQTKKSSNNLLTLLFSAMARAKAGMGELDAASAEGCRVVME
jgi:hypothetical protein